MDLPFTVTVEPPTRAEVRRAVRDGWRWLLAVGLLIGGGALALLLLSPDPQADERAAILHVTSVPSNAAVTIDDHQVGRTPITLPLITGDHRVSVGQRGYADAAYRVSPHPGQTTRIDAELWFRTPKAIRLRPVFPGATITGGGFLIDGRVALIIALPPGDDRQLWTVEPSGEIRRLGPQSTRGGLALSPDAAQVAFFRSSQSTAAGSGRPDELWTAGSDGQAPQQRYAVASKPNDERLTDLAWAPEGRRVLLVSRQQFAGGAPRTRLRSLDTGSGEVREVASLPSEVIAGSYTWSVDGVRVAFMTRSGQLTSLCVLDTATGDFRYLADLSRDESNPLPFAPLAWSPDGEQLLYAAPSQDRPPAGGWLFGSKPPTTLVAAHLTPAVDEQQSTIEGQFPVWLSDGRVLALRRGNGGGLLLQQVDPAGHAKDAIELPLKPASTYAVRWDPGHAQALIAVRSPAGLGANQADFWLVRFRPEQGP